MNFQTNKVFFTTMECKSHYHIGPEKLVVQVVLCEIDCVIFYTNLHKLSCRTVKTIVEQTLVTQPMLQLRPNQTELRSMDYYYQILCRF